MVKATLVDRDIEDGGELIKLLDSRGFPVDAALWCQLSETDDWKLYISSVLVDLYGPRASYGKLISVVRRDKPSLLNLLDEVRLVSPGTMLIAKLKDCLVTDKEKLSELRLEKCIVNELYIENAIIYRLLSPKDTIRNIAKIK